MMTEGRYIKIKSRFWSDEKVRGWDNDTKFLALYLLTSPHNNILGCYVLPKLYICADLGWTPEALAKPFAKLVEDGFIKYDEDTCLILLTNYLKHNPIDNGNRAEGAIKILEELPRSPLFVDLKKIIEEQGKDYLQKLAEALENKALKGNTEAFGKAFEEAFTEGDSKGNANPAHCTLQDAHCTLQEADKTHMPPSPSAPAEFLGQPEQEPAPKKDREKANKEDYTEEFEHFWAIYPRHVEKLRAFKAWKTRLREGELPEDIIKAAGNYARYCRQGNIEPRFIKHPSTFLGPSKPYKDFIRGLPEELAPRAGPRQTIPRAFASLQEWAEGDTT